MRRSARCRSGVLFLLLLISGCMVGPEYRRPDLALRTAWMESGSDDIRGNPVDRIEWWRAFQDPVLEGLVQRAYRDSLTLRITGARILQARAQLGIAIGEFFPQEQQASGSLQYTRSNFSDGTNASGSSSSARHTAVSTAQIGAMASWELDFWGRYRREIQSADAALLAANADYDSALVTLTADIATTYLTIRTLERRIAIAQENVLSQGEGLRIAQVRLRYGANSRLDVEQATALLESTRASIPPLETRLQQAKNALCILLGVPPADLPELRDAFGIPVTPATVAAGIPQDLLRRRADIRSAEYQAMAQSARIGIAKADLYPAFTLSGSFGFSGSDAGSGLGRTFDWSNRTFQAGPSFIWKLFTYGRFANNVRLQDARLQELLIAYQSAVITAQREVEDSLTAFARARRRADLLSASERSATAAFELALKQYREGSRDFTTVLTAQQALLAEQDSLATTLGDIASSLVGVYRALGGGWEIQHGKDVLPGSTKQEMAQRVNWGRLLDRGYGQDGETPSPLIREPQW